MSCTSPRPSAPAPCEMLPTRNQTFLRQIPGDSIPLGESQARLKLLADRARKMTGGGA